jgi:hypothetical protein
MAQHVIEVLAVILLAVCVAVAAFDPRRPS